MKEIPLFILLLVSGATAIAEDWIFYQPLNDYLACMSKYSKATFVEDMQDTYVSNTRTVPDKSKAKAVDVFKKEILTENKVLENKDDGMMPVSFKTVVTSSSTAMNQDVSGTTVGLSAGGGANVGKFGFSVSGSFEAGGLQNTSQVSQNVTQQSWERNFKVPPHMKVTRRMALYERHITMPAIYQVFIKGYLPIQFENVKASKYRELAKECGKSIPKPILGSGEKIFAVKVENFVPKTKIQKRSWKAEKDGTVTMDLMKTEAKETREFVLTETHVVLDPKVKLTEYCDDIDPEKETDPVSNTKMEKGDQVTKVEGNVNVNKVNFDYNFGSGDDDDDKKKPKNKNKNKNRRRKSGK